MQPVTQSRIEVWVGDELIGEVFVETHPDNYRPLRDLIVRLGQLAGGEKFRMTEHGA